MERNTARRAADIINELLVSHVDERPSNVDIHDAMAIRDELREVDSTKEWDLPKVGDLLKDTGHDARFGNGWVRVVEVLPNTPAEECYIEHNGYNRSVAELNPSHDFDAPVVKAQYVDGSDKTYAFPVTRLE